MSRFCAAAIAFFLAATAGAHGAPVESSAVPRTIVLDGRALGYVKQHMRQGGPAMQAALQTLIRNAEKECAQGPYTVTAKSKLPPSGDRRDYVSQGRYFWPDPTKRDGLPYIRKDGETNPASRGGDEEPLTSMAGATRTLALAYFLTSNDLYADHAALLLRTWFVDPQKRMNPRMLHGQIWPGHDTGRSEAILETRHLLRTIDAVALLASSPSLSEADRAGIRDWFVQYTAWLRTSPFGREEAASPNNHGSWFDAQLAAFALFIGDLPTARSVLESAKQTRFTQPIERDGRLPAELARVDAFGYSVFDLEALAVVAAVAERLDIDLWNYRSTDGRGFRAAADWLLPFAAGQKPWTFGKKQPVGHNDSLVVLYHTLANVYGDQRYAAFASSLPESNEPKHSIALLLEQPRLPATAIESGSKIDWRNPLPDRAALAAAMARVRQSMSAEHGPLKEQPALVRALAKQGCASGLGANDRFAWLALAREHAGSPLAASLLWTVLELTAQSFRIDPLQEFETELNRAAKKDAPPQAVVNGALAAVDQAVRKTRFDAATRLLSIASRTATTAKDSAMAQAVSARRIALTHESALYQAYHRSQRTLAQKPDDAAACLAAGCWFCFGAGDYHRGLPLLARGSNAELSALASACAAATADPQELKRRGDLWWERAQGATAAGRRDLEQGARHFYSLALAGSPAGMRAIDEPRLQTLGGRERDALFVDLLNPLPVAAAPAGAATGKSAGSASARVDVPVSQPANPEVAAAQCVQRHGGTLSIRPAGESSSATPVMIKPGDALPPGQFVVLVIDLAKCSTFSDADLKAFGSLQGLEELSLEKTAVGDDGLASLLSIKTLTKLNLDDTGRLTDEGLATLAQLTNLTELRLKRQKLTDAGMVHVQKLKKLSYLRLAYIPEVTDASLALLAKMPSLRYVNAEGTSITPAAADTIKSVNQSLRVRVSK